MKLFGGIALFRIYGCPRFRCCNLFGSHEVLRAHSEVAQTFLGRNALAHGLAEFSRIDLALPRSTSEQVGVGCFLVVLAW